MVLRVLTTKATEKSKKKAKTAKEPDRTMFEVF